MSSELQKPGGIPEDVQIGIQLEGIFTPQFTKKREAAFNITGSNDHERCTRFVHYTTAEAALSIIQTKRIWMRKTSCMSDYLEVEHGFEALRKVFGDTSKLDVFSKALDGCAPGAVEEAIQLFNGHLGNIRSSTYIASISEHNLEEDIHGRLSMWRAFGGNTGRVAIVFKLPWYSAGLFEAMKTLGLFFSPVVYMADSDYDNEFNTIIQNINANCDLLQAVDNERIRNNIFHMLLTGTVCSKHSGFREEKEWRVMHFPILWNSALIESEIKVIGGVPQKIYKLPLDATVSPSLAELDFSRIFDRLIIGPTEYPWAMFEAFSDALSNIGVKDANKQVCISNIPIRI